jgi:hypothetical protein
MLALSAVEPQGEGTLLHPQTSACMHTCLFVGMCTYNAEPEPLLVPCALPKQLEAFPVGKRVKQLRQHSNPAVQQQAARVLQKMRQDVKDACSREAKAKPILAHFKKRPHTSSTLDG